MTERMRILVVDDDPTVARAVQRRLAAHDASIATDGTSALAIVEAATGEGRPFDVVVCDLQMPDLSGTEVLARVRALRSVPPVLILMSGSDDLGAAASVADGVLLKPFRTSEILDLIARVKAKKACTTTQRLRRVRGPVMDQPR